MALLNRITSLLEHISHQIDILVTQGEKMSTSSQALTDLVQKVLDGQTMVESDFAILAKASSQIAADFQNWVNSHSPTQIDPVAATNLQGIAQRQLKLDAAIQALAGSTAAADTAAQTPPDTGTPAPAPAPEPAAPASGGSSPATSKSK